MALEAAAEVAGGDVTGSWQAHAVAAGEQRPRDHLQRFRIRSVCILPALTTLHVMSGWFFEKPTAKQTSLALKPSDASANR